MELKYLWIDKYKNINTTGFNLDYDGDDQFNYDGKEIFITKKQNKTIKDFFGANVSGVTAIVGQNGAGKTNLTEFINFNLAHVTNGGLETVFNGLRAIIIFGENIFYQESLEINNLKNLESLGYNFMPYKVAPLDKQGSRKWAEMGRGRYIYYSPHFDFRYIDIRNNFSNISTSYLAFNSKYDFFKYYTGDSFFNKFNTDSLTAFYQEQIINEADFILNYDVENLLGILPTNLIFNIDNVNKNKWLTRFDNNNSSAWNILDDLERSIKDNFLYLIRKWRKPRPEEEHKYTIIINFKDRLHFFEDLFIVRYYKVLLNNGKTINEDFIKNNKVSPLMFSDTVLQKKLELVNTNLKEIMLLAISNNEEIVTGDGYEGYDKVDGFLDSISSIELNLKGKKDSKKFYEFISLCKELNENLYHFHYQFYNSYSSGQQILLNFYSRFYAVYNEILILEKGDYEFPREKLFIFIDEGEIALHPEWQRTFFSKAISYLNELFKDRKIQLILTTHSPFVLSDLPQGNVIMLQKDSNGNTVVNDKSDDKTFGANIHTLFSDAFFMKSTLGEFAETKIRLVLDTLTKYGKDITDEKRKEIKFIIELIGEPILKQQLEYLYNKVFEYDELEFLRQRVRDLESQIDNSTTDDNSEN